MWAHYAGGFSGVALEYEIDPSECDIRKIDYLGTPVISDEQINDVNSKKLLPQDIGILKRKAACWEYEGEWRLYGDEGQEFLNNVKPMAVIFGAKHSRYIDIIIEVAKQNDIPRAGMYQSSGMKYEVEYY